MDSTAAKEPSNIVPTSDKRPLWRNVGTYFICRARCIQHDPTHFWRECPCPELYKGYGRGFGSNGHSPTHEPSEPVYRREVTAWRKPAYVAQREQDRLRWEQEKAEKKSGNTNVLQPREVIVQTGSAYQVPVKGGWYAGDREGYKLAKDKARYQDNAAAKTARE